MAIKLNRSEGKVKKQWSVLPYNGKWSLQTAVIYLWQKPEDIIPKTIYPVKYGDKSRGPSLVRSK